MTLPVVFHQDYSVPLRQKHTMPMSKYGYVRELLETRRFDGSIKFHVPEPATLSQVCLAHDADYASRVFSSTLSDADIRKIGLPWSDRLVLRTRLSAAGTVLAARLALESGIACNAAGGSHHAAPGYGAGFCVLNDVAIAAQTLLTEGLVRRVLVVDLDVHHGDGTALIFARIPAVITFSMHAERNYPSKKPPSDLDIGLEDGTKDCTYLDALDKTLAELEKAHTPDIVFFNAGIDVHAEDRLGRLGLSDEGIRKRDRLVLNHFHSRGIPIACVLGGGYDYDATVVAKRHISVFAQAVSVL